MRATLLTVLAVVACASTVLASTPLIRLSEGVASSASPLPPASLADGVCTFNGFFGQCQNRNDSTVCTEGTSVSGICADAGQGCCITQPNFVSGCGKAAVQRAQLWVNMQLQYCQAPNGQHDDDADCSSTCIRSSNPNWDAYRSDCSGLVSYAYGLPAPGRSTYEMAPYLSDISRVLDSPFELQPGDVLNSTPRAHVMMFVQWLDSHQTMMLLLEEPGCSSSQPYARAVKTMVSISGQNITVESNGHTFLPVRFNTNEPAC